MADRKLSISSQLQQHHVLNVLRVRKHIHGLHLLHAVLRVEQGEIAGLRGGVATHIDDARHLQLQQLLDDVRVHAGARRVGDDDIRFPVLRDELVGEDLRHIAHHELRVRDVVLRGVDLRILHGGIHVLDADHPFGLVRHEIGNRARAGEKVINNLIFLNVSKLAHHLVEVVGLLAVGLVERLRADLELQVLHLFGDVILTGIEVERQVEDGVIELGVDDEGQRGDFREPLHEGGEHVLHLLVVFRDDEHHHQVASGGGADDEVAQQPFLLARVVEVEVVIDGVLLAEEPDVVARGRLQPAVLDIQDLIEHAGHVETETTVLEELALLLPFHILVGQPQHRGEGVFQRVAVVLDLLRPEDGHQRRELELAEVREVILDLFLLEL